MKAGQTIKVNGYTLKIIKWEYISNKFLCSVDNKVVVELSRTEILYFNGI